VALLGEPAGGVGLELAQSQRRCLWWTVRIRLFLQIQLEERSLEDLFDLRSLQWFKR